MNKQILEEVKRYRELLSYDTKLTLSENLENITEVKIGASTVKELETLTGKNLLTFMKELKIGSTTAEEIGKLLAMDSKNFQKEFVKALTNDVKSGVKGQLGPLSKEMSKIETLRNIAAEAKVKGGALTKAEVDAIILRVKNANDIKAAKFKPKTPKPKKEDINKAEDEFGKVTDPNKRNWSWSKFKKWGLTAGITTAALYALYVATKGEEPPIVTGEIEPVPTVTPTVTNQKQTSKYSSCPETFPINQYCKNGKIKEIQACLNMPSKYQTGNFGPITQGYLERAGVSGTEITQDSYNKVCNKTTSTTTVQPDENPEEQTISGSDDNF
jgi:hypothetical protein